MGSISFSGHLIINTVPTTEKYKILLWYIYKFDN